MQDKSLWIVVGSALLTLSSVSLLLCPTAHAGASASLTAPTTEHTPTDASKTALSFQPEEEGDELLEHWSDPKFVKEERLQTAGILVLLSGAGGAAAYRTRARRRRDHSG